MTDHPRFQMISGESCSGMATTMALPWWTSSYASQIGG